MSGKVAAVPTEIAYVCKDRAENEHALNLPLVSCNLGRKTPSVAATGVFSTPLTAAACMTKPSWAIVARANRAA
jgi:hypothetical protein